MVIIVLLDLLLGLGSGAVISGIVFLLVRAIRKRLPLYGRRGKIVYFGIGLIALVAFSALVWLLPMGTVAHNADHQGFALLLIRKSFAFGLVPGAASLAAVGVCLLGNWAGVLASEQTEVPQPSPETCRGPSEPPPIPSNSEPPPSPPSPPPLPL